VNIKAGRHPRKENVQQNTADMNGIINKSRCSSLYSQHEEGGSKICFNSNKRKLVPKPRRLCRQRKMLSVIVTEAAFADHQKMPTVKK